MMFGVLRPSVIALACMVVISLPVSVQARPKDEDTLELEERIREIEDENRQRDIDLDDLRQKILDEARDRFEGDADLRDRILDEVGNRQDADSDLQQAIIDEVFERGEGDLEVARQIIGEIFDRFKEDSELRKAIVDESVDRIKGDAELLERIVDATRPDPGDAVLELEKKFDDFVREQREALAELEAKLAEEEAERKEADEKLQRAIDNLLNGDPAVAIDSPNGGEFFYSDYTGGTDANGPFVQISFIGQAVDLADGELDGASLQWTTDQSALQPGQQASIGEGKTIQAKLYHEFGGDCYIDCCGAGDNFTPHKITLTATDSTGRTAEATIAINVASGVCLI